MPFVTFVGNLIDDGRTTDVEVIEVDNHFQPDETGNELDFSEIPVITVHNHQIATIPTSVVNSEPQNLPDVNVVIDRKFYKVGSNHLVDAIDMCYKAIILMNIGFPAEGKNYWCVLHTMIYQSKVGVFSYKNVKELISALDKIQIAPVESD